MTRTRGQAKTTEVKASTKSNKIQKKIETKRVSVVVERLDSSVLESLGEISTPRIKEKPLNVAKSKEPTPPPETTGRATRTLRGKENKNEQKTEATKPKTVRKKPEAKTIESTVAKRATRGSRKAPDEPKPEEEKREEPKKAVASKKPKRGEKKDVQETIEQVEDTNDVPKARECEVRIEKLPSDAYDSIVVPELAQKRSRQTKTQVKKSSNDDKKGESSADKKEETNLKRTRGNSKKEKTLAAEDARESVEKRSESEKKEEKTDVGRRTRKASVKSVDPPKEASKRPLRNRAKSVIADDDKLNGTLTPQVELGSRDVTKKLPEDSKKKSKKPVVQEKSKLVAKKTKKEEVPKRTTRGVKRQVQEKAPAPRKTRGRTAKNDGQVAAIEDQVVNDVEDVGIAGEVAASIGEASASTGEATTSASEAAPSVEAPVTTPNKIHEPQSSEPPLPSKRAKRGKKTDATKDQKVVEETPAPSKAPASPEFKAPLQAAAKISPSLKIIENDDGVGEDPYSFNASQSEVPHNQKKKKVVKGKKRQQGKAGNTINLLMQKETLDVALYSMNTQSNPSKYKDDVVQVEKQINVPGPSIPKVVILDQPEKVPVPSTSTAVAPRRALATATTSESSLRPSTSTGSTTDARKSFAFVPRRALVTATVSEPSLRPSTSGFTPNPRKVSSGPNIHSKVWHSPPVSTTKTLPVVEETISTTSYISNSPPIQSAFAIRMAAERINKTSSTPFRVPGNLPSAFYMGLSKNDGTPTFSSDLVEKEPGNESVEGRNKENSKRKSCESSEGDEDRRENDENCRENYENRQENDENQQENDENQQENTSNTSLNRTILGDSNAENMEPPGFIKSPFKKRKLDRNARSPLKALAIPKIPEGDVSSISVFNTTMDQSIAVKTVKVVASNTSVDYGELCDDEAAEVAENVSSSSLASEESGAAKVVRRESVDYGALCDDEAGKEYFGFEDLLEDSQQGASTSNVVTETSGELQNQLKNIKKYLPSKNNKDRDKHIFPTTPIKHSDVFKGPSESAPKSIQSFMTASTPLVNNTKKSEKSFGNVSKIIESNEKDDSIEDEDNTNFELFGDQTEVYNPQRSYTRRKRVPEFLKRVEDPASDSEDDVEKKGPTRTKKKKLNVEETAEFKRFVNDKSSEFAEVDQYELVVEEK